MGGEQGSSDIDGVGAQMVEVDEAGCDRAPFEVPDHRGGGGFTVLDDGDDASGESLMADLDARFELYTHLRMLLGDKDSYWMAFDVAQDGQSMSGSLADDLTDIYCELKHGLRLVDREPSKAMDDWCSGFRMHWGQHLMDAERHLYELKSQNQL